MYRKQTSPLQGWRRRSQPKGSRQWAGAPPGRAGLRISGATMTKPRKSRVRMKKTSPKAMTTAWAPYQESQLLEGCDVGIGAARRHGLGEIGEGLFGRGSSPGDALVQPCQMQVGAIVEQGVDQREADRAAEITGEIEQTRGVFDSLRRQCAKRQIGDRHHAEHQRKAAQNLRHEQFPEIPIFGDGGGLQRAEREADEAGGQQPSRIDLRRQATGDRRRHEHAHARYEHRIADHQRRIAAHFRGDRPDRDRSAHKDRRRGPGTISTLSRNCGR